MRPPSREPYAIPVADDESAMTVTFLNVESNMTTRRPVRSCTMTRPPGSGMTCATLASGSVELFKTGPIGRTGGSACCAQPTREINARTTRDERIMFRGRSMLVWTSVRVRVRASWPHTPATHAPTANSGGGVRERVRARTRGAGADRLQIPRVERAGHDVGQSPALLRGKHPLDSRRHLQQQVDGGFARGTIARVYCAMVVVIRQRGERLRDRCPDRVHANRVPAVERRDAVRHVARQMQRVALPQDLRERVEHGVRAVDLLEHLLLHFRARRGTPAIECLRERLPLARWRRVPFQHRHDAHRGERGIVRRARRTETLVHRIDEPDRKSTRLNSSHRCISYAAFCL